MIKHMLQVFAAKNSPNKKGKGLIFARFAKQQINGVNVKIIISLDVKMVKRETTIYNLRNNPICLLCFCFTILFARYWKNPSSSKNMDKKVILKNNINILKGFTEDGFVIRFQTKSKGKILQHKITMAENKEMSQYVPIWNLPIRMVGLKITDKQTNIPVIIIMTHAKIIKMHFLVNIWPFLL